MYKRTPAPSFRKVEDRSSGQIADAVLEDRESLNIPSEVKASASAVGSIVEHGRVSEDGE